MKNIQDHQELNQKKVLLRLDLNVPLKNGEIKDETRIIKILPTLKFLLEKKAKIIIISHIGRPKGKVNSDLSMKPVCKYLEKKLNQKIRYPPCRASEGTGQPVVGLLEGWFNIGLRIASVQSYVTIGSVVEHWGFASPPCIIIKQV